MPAAMPVFNTLKSADALMAAGVPDAQARATVQMMADVLDANMDRLATKDDIKLQGLELRSEMQQLSTELRGEMQQLSTNLQRRMDKIEAELGHVKWMSGPVALVAVIWVAKEALKVFGVSN